jgi:hypothetical protein
MTCTYCNTTECDGHCIAACKAKFPPFSQFYTGGSIEVVQRDMDNLYANNVYSYLKCRLTQGYKLLIEDPAGYRRSVSLDEMKQD